MFLNTYPSLLFSFSSSFAPVCCCGAGDGKFLLPLTLQLKKCVGCDIQYEARVGTIVEPEDEKRVIYLFVSYYYFFMYIVFLRVNAYVDINSL